MSWVVLSWYTAHWQLFGHGFIQTELDRCAGPVVAKMIRQPTTRDFPSASINWHQSTAHGGRSSAVLAAVRERTLSSEVPTSTEVPNLVSNAHHPCFLRSELVTLVFIFQAVVNTPQAIRSIYEPP